LDDIRKENHRTTGRNCQLSSFLYCLLLNADIKRKIRVLWIQMIQHWWTAILDTTWTKTLVTDHRLRSNNDRFPIH